jgi:hypothetical protein
MNFKELYEGVEPTMPGAPKGIQIMTPQQFVAKSGDMPGEEVDEQSNNDWPAEKEKIRSMSTTQRREHALARYAATNDSKYAHIASKAGAGHSEIMNARKGEEKVDEFALPGGDDREPDEEEILRQLAAQWWLGTEQQMAKAQRTLEIMGWQIGQDESGDDDAGVFLVRSGDENGNSYIAFNHSDLELNENKDLARIRKLSGLDEATALPASTRDLKGQEFQDYMNRIKGTDDIDKKTGQVKLDKKGNEKYVSGKTKGDKYKMPYIHRSSIIEYLGPDGKTYDEDKIKQSLSQRPKSLLKQNEKMKHSNGEFEQFFNVGFAALTGIAVDEQTNNLIIVNTCPGAGSCKVDCFAMKGGKVQFKAAWQSDGRILTYLLNDPSGFFNQLSSEISKEEQLGQKGDKKFPNGWKTTIRWHDAGDFFSPEYLDMALDMAAKHPDTKFYAYTKMAGAALAQKPPNFIINWSEGANTSQEKQVKAKDANLDTTKNSRIVPDDLFQDLLVKDEKKNLVKGASGQWQVQPDKLPELKQRLASEYGLSANSILSYDEYMAKRKSIPAGMKYNVIVAPGEGDISANDPNIISTLLLRH